MNPKAKRQAQYEGTKVYTAQVEMTNLKALDDLGDEGGFEGYASVFNVVDLQNDVILPGAFESAIKGFVRDGFITVNHDWMDIGVATIEEAFEDERGLYIRARFHTDDISQGVRTRIAERIARGKTVGLSVGFQANFDDIEFRDDGVALFRQIIKLVEVALTNIPANPLALATNAKSLEAAGEPGQESVVLELDMEIELGDVLVLLPADLADAHGEAIAESLSEITGQEVSVLHDLTEGDEPAGDDDPPDETPEGVPFVEEADGVLAALSAFGERAASLAEMRARDGRTLSDDRRGRIAEIAEGMKAQAESLASLAMQSEADTHGEHARRARAARLAKHRLALMEQGSAE